MCLAKVFVTECHLEYQKKLFCLKKNALRPLPNTDLYYLEGAKLEIIFLNQVDPVNPV